MTERPAGFDQGAPDQDKDELNESRVEDIAMNDGNLTLQIVSTERAGGGISGGFTQYLIEGRDSLGEIKVARRFKEFLYLREMLFERYPGLVIPPVPSKVMRGSLGDEVVSERRLHLDMFLQQICYYKYYAQMPEVQVFLRPVKTDPKAPALEAMKSLERATTDHVLRYYQVKLPTKTAITEYP